MDGQRHRIGECVGKPLCIAMLYNELFARPPTYLCSAAALDLNCVRRVSSQQSVLSLVCREAVSGVSAHAAGDARIHQVHTAVHNVAHVLRSQIISIYCN